MNKIFSLFFYYILLLLGLTMTSWMIWSRFIRKRTIRDIPDYLLTEYRFWILLYICCIYLYVVKNLLKPKETNIIFKDIINYLYKPLMTLDHFIKYNKYIKPYYYKFMIKVVKKIDVFEMKHFTLQIIIFFMQIFSRIILITFLLLDAFYFQRLEIFYKVVLIGILPFILRYIKYSLKDVYEQWILDLESKYYGVTVYEEDYRFDAARKGNTDAIYHYKIKTIKEYIEIKFENIFDYYSDKVTYEYDAFPHCFHEFLQQYIYEKYECNKGKYKYNSSPYYEEFFKVKGYDKFFADFKSIQYSDERLQKEFDIYMSEKYIFDKYRSFIINEEKPYIVKNKLSYDEIEQLSSKDYGLLKELYYDLMPSIINLKLFFYRFDMINESKIIRWPKIIIFSLYFICWSYILIISYWNYPIELLMGKYFLINFMRYLVSVENPFVELYWGSLNENLITVKSIKYIINKIVKRFFQ